jgi:hypothetical protein
VRNEAAVAASLAVATATNLFMESSTPFPLIGKGVRFPAVAGAFLTSFKAQATTLLEPLGRSPALLFSCSIEVSDDSEENPSS